MSAQHARTYEEGLAEGRREGRNDATLELVQAALAEIKVFVAAEVRDAHTRITNRGENLCAPHGERIMAVEGATRRQWWALSVLLAGVGATIGLLIRVAYSMGAL